MKTLPLHTRGEDIFKIIDRFFNDNSMPWDKCAGPTVQRHVLASTPELLNVSKIKHQRQNGFHCFLHRQALAAKGLSEELHDTLNSVKMCQLYKSKAA